MDIIIPGTERNDEFKDAKFERKPHGIIFSNGQEVAHTLQCPHCMAHFISRKGSGLRRTFCMKCSAVTCGNPACDPCRPFVAEMGLSQGKMVQVAQHQRPIGPTGTNAAAPFGPEMVSDARPQRPTLGKPQPTGWMTSQTSHVSAPFGMEMTAGAHPDRSRDWLPLRQGWSVSQTTHVPAPFSAEMVAGWHPDSPRPYVAPRTLVSGWQTSQTTHVSAGISVEMLAGYAPVQRPRQDLRVPVGLVAYTPEVFAFSIEMVQGSHPDLPRLFLAPRIPLPVAQTSHVPAAFSVEMSAGSGPSQPPKLYRLSLRADPWFFGPLESFTVVTVTWMPAAIFCD